MSESIKKSRLQERLQVRDFKLNALLDLTKGINDNLSTSDLLIKYREVVLERLGISRIVLFMLENEEWRCLLQVGMETNFEHFDTTANFGNVRDIQLIPNHIAEEFEGFGIVVPVFHEENALAYLVLGDVDEEELRISPSIKHMKFLQTITNILVVAIENKRLVEKKIEQERLNRELELTAEMQSLLVALQDRQPNWIEHKAFFQPHSTMGGDYYDMISLDENRTAFCLADVSGKGISAAFLMANFQAYLHALLDYTTYSLEQVVTELNFRVMNSMRGERFITFFIGIADKSTHELAYINAGHLSPLFWNGNDFNELDKGTIGLGMLEELPFIEKGTIQFKSENLVVLYTDGVTEVENEEQEEFGQQNLELAIRENLNKKITEINKAIITRLEKHRGNQPYFDDTTLLTIRFR